MIRHEVLHLVNENKKEGENKYLVDLHKLTPEELQGIKFNLNPHQMMEQIHYMLKDRIIKYSISIQKERKREKTEIETRIAELNEELKRETMEQEERLDKQNTLARKESVLENIEEHQVKGASVRSRQEWDINAEGLGKILLKCEDKYGQQKYMQSIVKKNERGEIITKIIGQK